MQRSLVFVAISLGVWFAPIAQPQAVAGPSIGVVNAERLLIESEAAKTVQARIEREFGERDRALRTERRALQDLHAALERDRASLSQSAIASREDAIASRERLFQRDEARYRDALNERRLEEVRKLRARADDAVRRVANEEAIDLVLQDVLFASPRMDITSKVLKLLTAP